MLAGAAAVIRRAVGPAAVLARADDRTIGILLTGAEASDARRLAAAAVAALADVEVEVEVRLARLKPGDRTPPARTRSGS